VFPSRARETLEQDDFSSNRYLALTR
jgi:hypothetical protein